METNPPTKPDDAQRMKSANLRTALTFASFAVAFFAGIIATKWMGERDGCRGAGVSRLRHRPESTQMSAQMSARMRAPSNPRADGRR